MNAARAKAIRLVFVWTCLAGFAAASVIPVGSKGTGSIDNLGEVDAWILPVLKGSKLSIKVQGKQDVRPVLALVALEGGLALDLTEVMTGPGTAKVGVKQLVITKTEWLRLEISGGETVGSYTLTTSAKVPPSLTSFTGAASQPGPGGSEVFSFDAPPGSRLDVTLVQKDSKLPPTIAGLTGPAGPVIIAPAISAKGNKTTLKGLIVKDHGSYQLTVVPSGSVASLKTKLKLKLPKKPKKPVIEGADPAVTSALDAFLDSDGLPGHGIEDLAASLAHAYAVSPDPAGAIDGLRASLIQALHGKADMDLLKALSAQGSPIVSIPKMAGPATTDGSLADCGTPTVVYYVNGVLSDKVSAIHSATLLAAMVHHAATPLDQDLQFKLYYNPTGLDGELIDVVCGSLADVLAMMDPQTGWLGLLQAALQISAAAFENACSAVLGSTLIDVIVDLIIESPAQWIAQILAKPPAGGVVLGFSNAVRADINSGRTVVIVAHSQGNFVTSEALAQLSSNERKAVGVVAVASPSFYPQQGSYGAFGHFTLSHDIIQLVAGSLPPNVDNILSLGSSCTGSVFTLPTCVKQAVGIHAFDGSYLKYANSNQGIVNAVVADADSLVNTQAPIGQGFLQVTLTWNIPGDIDLHIFEPTGEHVWWNDQQGDVGEIDVDDIPGDGPENYFVCKQSDLVPGTYAIDVNNYDGTTGTQCVIAVHAGDNFATFHVTVGAPNEGQTLIPVASVNYANDGTFSISGS